MKHLIQIIILLHIFSLYAMDKESEPVIQNSDYEETVDTESSTFGAPKRAATVSTYPSSPVLSSLSNPNTLAKHGSQSAPELDSIKPSPRISTLGQLKELKKSNKNKPSPKNLEIDPAVAASVAYIITRKKDPDENLPAFKDLTEKLAVLKATKPNKYKDIEKYVILMNDALEGNITAAGLISHKSKKNNTSKVELPSLTKSSKESSKSDSPPHEIPRSKLGLSSHTSQPILKLQSDTPRTPAELEYDEELKRIEEQLKDLEDVKKQLKELTHDASEDAQLKEQKKANRIAKLSIIFGTAATVVVGAVGAVVGYIAAINAAHISGGGNCQPCSNGTFM